MGGGESAGRDSARYTDFGGRRGEEGHEEGVTSKTSGNQQTIQTLKYGTRKVVKDQIVSHLGKG